MRRPIRDVLLAAALVTAYAATATAQSFNCRYAHYADERAICRSFDLSKLDDQLAAVFARAMRLTPPDRRTALQQQETRWVVTRRRCGSDDACIAQSYRDRMAALTDRTGEPGEAVFHPADNNAAPGAETRPAGERQAVASPAGRPPPAKGRPEAATVHPAVPNTAANPPHAAASAAPPSQAPMTSAQAKSPGRRYSIEPSVDPDAIPGVPPPRY